MFKKIVNFFRNLRRFKKYHLTLTLDAYVQISSIGIYSDGTDDIYHKIRELRHLNSSGWRLKTERSKVFSDYSYEIILRATFIIEAESELEARDVINHVLKQVKARVSMFGHWRQKIYIPKGELK